MPLWVLAYVGLGPEKLNATLSQLWQILLVHEPDLIYFSIEIQILRGNCKSDNLNWNVLNPKGKYLLFIN